MTNEQWMQLYLQAWWALTHEDDYFYSVFYSWNDFWYGTELYSWWEPRIMPQVRRFIAYPDGKYILYIDAD